MSEADHARAVWQRLRADIYPDRDDAGRWSSAEPYLLRHAAKHAADAGELDELIADAEFMVYADAPLLAAQLPTISPARTSPDARTLFRASYPAHHSLDPARRRQILLMDAARLGQWNRSDRLSAHDAWTVRWSTGSGRSPAIRQCLMGPDIPVRGIAVTAVGNRTHVVAAHGDNGHGAVLLWELATGTKIRELWARYGEDPEPTCAAATAVGGIPCAAIGFDDGGLRVWDLTSGALVSERADAQPGGILSLAVVGPLGAPRLVTGGRDGGLRVWDPASGALVLEITSAHVDEVRAMAAVPPSAGGGRAMVVTGGGDGLLRTWDLDHGTALAISGPRSAGVNSVAVAGRWDGVLLAVAGHADGTVTGWDLATGRQVLRPVTAHQDGVTAVVLDGRPYAITGGGDGLVQIWDLRTGRPKHQMSGQAEGMTTVAMAKLGDGRSYAVSGGFDGAVRVWDLDPGSRRLRAGHPSRVSALSVTPLDATPRLVSAGRDGSMAVWDLSTGQEPDRINVAIGRSQAMAVYLAGGTRPVLICADEQGVTVHGLTGHALAIPAGGQARSLAAGRVGAGAVLAVGLDGRSADGVELWALPSGITELEQPEPLGMLGAGGVRAVAAATFAAGPRVAVVTDDDVLRIWDARSLEQVAQLPEEVPHVRSVALAEVGGHVIVAAGTGDATVELWNAGQGQLLDVLNCPDPVWAVGIAPDGSLVLGQGPDIFVVEHRFLFERQP
jgi:WD40 repeat protein